MYLYQNEIDVNDSITSEDNSFLTLMDENIRSHEDNLGNVVETFCHNLQSSKTVVNPPDIT